MFSHPGTRCLLVLLFIFAASGVSGQNDELQKKINEAIDRGVANLKGLGVRGTWGDHPFFSNGMTALAAWTLLESDVSEKDQVVQKAAAHLRREAVKLEQTYTQALAILFFDRLGDPGDEALIQALGVRLLAGQRNAGTWTYFSKWGEQSDLDWLRKHVEEAERQRQAGTAPAAKNTLLPQIREQLDRLKKAEIDRSQAGDNSNTQFAMLALWVARRHGLPVDDALAKVASHFRHSQHPGGGWGYSTGFAYMAPRATMTCAGLLGLALGKGVQGKKAGKEESLHKDPMVARGLRLLGEVLKNPDGPGQKALLEKPGRFHYFLFSLERMAVVYNLKKIGDKDWYEWGARILVDKQNKDPKNAAVDGSWTGEHGAADTCFALLFLKRANVAHDLTLDLNPIIKTPNKKKIKKSEREKDPFDLPPDKEKKKIKIRPKDKDKQTSRLLPRNGFNPLSRSYVYLEETACREPRRSARRSVCPENSFLSAYGSHPA